MLVNKKGDQPPSFAPGYPCQASAYDLVASYIDPQTGVVTIADNQALYLWDFNPLYTHTGIDFQDLIILATAVSAASVQDSGGTTPPPPSTPPAGQQVSGRVNLNPRNNQDFEFELLKPDGTRITRDTLLFTSNQEYNGPATSVRFCPKGNGNQNGMTVDGQEYAVDNGTLYTISSTTMTVHLYNDRWKQGRGMGQWWITMEATGATITKNK